MLDIEKKSAVCALIWTSTLLLSVDRTESRADERATFVLNASKTTFSFPAAGRNCGPTRQSIPPRAWSLQLIVCATGTVASR